MLHKMKMIFYTFVCVTTCVVFGTAAYIELFLDNPVLDVDVLWQILLVSFLCSLCTAVYQDEMSRKLQKILVFVHYLAINIIVLGCGVWFGWFRPENLSEVVGMLLVIALVFLIVSAVMWRVEKQMAAQMNERLREYQERHKEIERKEQVH